MCIVLYSLTNEGSNPAGPGNFLRGQEVLVTATPLPVGVHTTGVGPLDDGVKEWMGVDMRNELCPVEGVFGVETWLVEYSLEVLFLLYDWIGVDGVADGRLALRVGVLNRVLELYSTKFWVESLTLLALCLFANGCLDSLLAVESIALLPSKLTGLAPAETMLGSGLLSNLNEFNFSKEDLEGLTTLVLSFDVWGVFAIDVVLTGTVFSESVVHVLAMAGVWSSVKSYSE